MISPNGRNPAGATSDGGVGAMVAPSAPSEVSGLYNPRNPAQTNLTAAHGSGDNAPVLVPGGNQADVDRESSGGPKALETCTEVSLTRTTVSFELHSPCIAQPKKQDDGGNLDRTEHYHSY
jgi:hypothetical protein